MGGFLVKYSDINNIMWEYKEKLTALMDDIAVVKKSVEEFTQLESFKGEAAESIKNYMEDVHITLLSSLEVAAQNLLDNMILYKTLYYAIDDSTNFVLSEDVIEEFRAKLTDSCLDTDDQGDIVSNAVNDIEDLITLTPPEFYKDTVADAHERADNELINLLESVREHELTSVQRVEQSAEALISELKNCIKKTSTNHTDINNYEKNSYYTDPDIYRLSYLSEAIYKQHEDNKDVYDLIWTAEEEKKAQADARNTEGIWEMIGGATLIVGGTVCIIATAGAATPVVIAGAAAGGGATIFGMSDFGEGVQDAYYGSIGDIDSIAVNKLKDDLFMGNEEYYYMAEECISFAASALVPIGAAGKAGELTFRSGAKTVGKMTVSSLAGKGASELTMELTDNRALSMLAGMAADMTTGFGLEAVDGKISVWTKSKGGSVPVVKTQKNVEMPLLPEGSQWERNVLNSFAGGKSTPVTYGGGTTLYRVGGKNGGFWSLDPPPATEYQWRVDFAIKQEFCNDASTLYKITIPEGSSLSGLEGTVGTQGMGLYGGAHQVYIDYRAVPSDWIEISPTNWK